MFLPFSLSFKTPQSGTKCQKIPRFLLYKIPCRMVAVQFIALQGSYTYTSSCTPHPRVLREPHVVFDSHPRDVAILILDISKTNRAGGLRCYQHFLQMPEHIRIKKKSPPFHICAILCICVCHIRRRQKHDYLNRGKYHVSGKRQ